MKLLQLINKQNGDIYQTNNSRKNQIMSGAQTRFL